MKRNNLKTINIHFIILVVLIVSFPSLAIIFLTTSIEHAPESFETGTLRYLLKPLSVDKFYEAMDVALAKAEKAIQTSMAIKKPK